MCRLDYEICARKLFAAQLPSSIYNYTRGVCGGGGDGGCVVVGPNFVSVFAERVRELALKVISTPLNVYSPIICVCERARARARWRAVTCTFSTRVRRQHVTDIVLRTHGCVAFRWRTPITRVRVSFGAHVLALLSGARASQKLSFRHIRPAPATVDAAQINYHLTFGEVFARVTFGVPACACACARALAR